MHIANPFLTDRMRNLFRLRFRIPYESFLSLSEEIIQHPLFEQWTHNDAVGCRPSNIKLLLLGSLWYLGRAWTLDDVYEANGISINTNRDFLLTFIEYGSTVLYKKYVIDPSQNIDLDEREKQTWNSGTFIPAIIAPPKAPVIVRVASPLKPASELPARPAT